MPRTIPINDQTWLICGGRDFTNDVLFSKVMEGLIDKRGLPRKVVQGGANGADAMGDIWARAFGLENVTVNADWQRDGRAAGPIRNARMLSDHAIDLVVAFPGGRGTADMVKKARRKEIDVAEVTVK